MGINLGECRMLTPDLWKQLLLQLMRRERERLTPARPLKTPYVAMMMHSKQFIDAKQMTACIGIKRAIDAPKK